jgi:hypothetical protein
MRHDRAVSFMTTEDAETINACLSFSHQAFYGDKKFLETEDERMTEERIIEVIAKLMPENYILELNKKGCEYLGEL